MEMRKQESTIRISKKNIAVGLGKSLGWATLSYLTTAALGAVFSDKTFDEIVVESLRPGIVRGTVAVGSIALSAYGFAGEDAYEDWFEEQSEEDLFN